MDDMKRAMYIAARNAVQKSEPSIGIFICWNLKDELSILLNAPLVDLPYEVEELLEEFFPEFFDLFDYTFWGDTIGTRYNDDKRMAWFARSDKKRRLAILDFIIANR